MSNHLVISALGDDKLGIVEQLTETITECGCNIEESRMSALGGTFAVIMLTSGNWNTIAKLESSLPALEQKLSMAITSRRTAPVTDAKRKRLLPYAVDVVAIDHPGLVHKLANFFSGRNINIEELITSSYSAAHTGTSMFSVHMEVGIPSDIQIAELRDTFMDYCDQMNLDAVIEPLK
jgi:glycine cleavage system transcriptional repressor